MATTGKKEYTIKINGIAQGIADVTKLEAALNKLDGTVDKGATATVAATKAATSKKLALTEEEKAAKKLADTQARLAQVDSDANKKQIAAIAALRDRTREVTRAVIQEGLEEDSIAAMGMQLTDLRNEYEKLSAAQRNDEEVGGKLLDQIQALDSEYKALRESTGNFRDSVGDYKKGIAGLNDLKDGLDKVGNGSTALAANVSGSNALLDTFGETSATVSKSAESLYGIISLGAQAQAAYNAVVKEGVIQTAATAVVDGVRTVQAKAAAAAIALESEATVGATVAQAAFNIVAAANPYVLLALALVAVVGAIYAFVSSTDKSAETQKRANDIMAITLEQLDAYSAKLKESFDRQTQAAQAALDLANAQADGSVKGIARIRSAEDELYKVRLLNNARQRGFYAEEIDNIDANKKKIDKLREVLEKLKTAQAFGDSKAKIDIDLDGKIDNVKVEDAINSVQGAIDNYNKKVEIGVQIKTDQAQIAADAATTAAARKRQDEELAKEQRAAQLADLRALQDDQAKSVKDTYDERRRLIKQANEREIEDLRIRLQTDKTLTEASRKSIEANIVALKKATTKQLHDEDLERQASELQSARDVIDTRNALIIGANDREAAEIKTKYDRETHDLQNKLKNDTTLTVTQQAYITEQIANIQKLRDRELAALQATGLEERASTELAALDDNLQAQRDKITKFTGEVTVRSKTGLQLINVAATKKNLSDTNAALSSYIAGLKGYQTDLDNAHAKTLETLQKGTPEYKAELDKYAKATADNTKKIGAAQNEQTENTRKNKDAQIEYYRDLSSKISGYAQEAVNIFQQGTALFSQSVQSQLDSLNGMLDAVNTKYDAAKDLQDKAVAAVQTTEQQLQDATGGTAEALKSQLADQIRARNEAARSEQQLAKQKEKLEADIAKKEKQAKRLELLSNIAGAIATGAQAVVQALAAYPPPFSYIAAGITAAFAGAQVAIMTKQLTKLATGGPIKGPSHADGGVRLGDQYEVEGGEFVVNKQAYSNNAQLVDFINSNKGALSIEDLFGVIPSATPAPMTQSNNNSDIVDAINAIDIRPVVAVTDIQDVENQITDVRELAGY